jgi:hypothetical protein
VTSSSSSSSSFSTVIQSSTETTTRAASTTTRERTIQTSTATRSSSSSSYSAPTYTRIVGIPEESLTPEQQANREENRQHQSTLSRIPHNVWMTIIIVASVLGGLLIIWTAVRKWKLRSSSSFQARLAPIDWQPDSDKATSGGLAPPAMSDVSDKDSIRRNMFAPDYASTAQSSLAPPAHDFTAGTGAGAAGYARSASPLSNQYGGMQRTASPAPYGARAASPGPGLERYPSNGSSGRDGYDPVRRGY